jgi:hypothetical protein
MTVSPDSGRSPGQVLNGLLGPSGPELTCEECFEHLDVYVEHELAGDNAEERVPGMRAHLDGCPACAEEHDSLQDLIASDTGGRTR